MMGVGSHKNFVGAWSESWKVRRTAFLDRTTMTIEKVTRVHEKVMVESTWPTLFPMRWCSAIEAV